MAVQSLDRHGRFGGGSFQVVQRLDHLKRFPATPRGQTKNPPVENERKNFSTKHVSDDKISMLSFKTRGRKV